jgi:hypothetical protein
MAPSDMSIGTFKYLASSYDSNVPKEKMQRGHYANNTVAQGVVDNIKRK